MTENEATALAALRAYALRVQAYQAVIDAPNVNYSSPAYIEAANAMDNANETLLAAAAPLLEPVE
jgi:hypothetical protein